MYKVVTISFVDNRYKTIEEELNNFFRNMDVVFVTERITEKVLESSGATMKFHTVVLYLKDKPVQLIPVKKKTFFEKLGWKI